MTPSSTGTLARVTDWVDRLEQSVERLRELRPRLDEALTSPDPTTGEQWTGAQVLAHVAELLQYWPAEARRVIAAGTTEVEFGRTKADPVRVAAVAAVRGRGTADLFHEVFLQIAATADWLGGLTDDELVSTGRHVKRGSMTVADTIEHFVVGHVEEHVQQLHDALADGSYQ